MENQIASALIAVAAFSMLDWIFFKKRATHKNYKNRLQTAILALDRKARRTKIKRLETDVDKALSDLKKKSTTTNKNSLENILFRYGINIEPKYFLSTLLTLYLMIILIIYQKYSSVILSIILTTVTVSASILVISIVLRSSQAKKIEGEFVDALDIIIRGIRSGLTIQEAISLATKEIGRPLSDELQRMLDSLNVGSSMEEAMEDFSYRLGTPEAMFLSTVVGLQSKTGGSLTEGLTNLAGTLRDRKALRDKIKALSAEGRASAMIVIAIPFCIFLINTVVAPELTRLLIENPTGRIISIVAAVWMALGVFVMIKMIKIKV